MTLVGIAEDVEVIFVNVVAGKNISNELQDGGLSDTSFPNKKDRVWCVRLVL